MSIAEKRPGTFFYSKLAQNVWGRIDHATIYPRDQTFLQRIQRGTNCARQNICGCFGQGQIIPIPETLRFPEAIFREGNEGVMMCLS